MQPSPVKKKLSLSDYSRRKKAETPSTAVNADKQLGMAPNAPLRATPSIPEEAKPTLLPEGTAVLASPPIKDELPSAGANDSTQRRGLERGIPLTEF
jgi:hypothetical protein